MITDTLQIIFLLGITALFVWLYYRIQLMGVERDKKNVVDNFSDLRIKYSSLLTRYTKVEDDMIKLKSETQDIIRQHRSTELQVQDLLIAEETYKTSLAHLESYKKKHDEQLTKMRETETRAEALQLGIKKLEREKTDIQAELTRKQVTIESQQKAINELVTIKNAYTLLQSEHENIQYEIISMSDKVQLLTTEKQQLNEKIKNNAMQINTLQATLRSLESIKERYDKLLPLAEQYKTKASALNQDLVKAHQTIALLEGKISKNEMHELMQQQTQAVLSEIRNHYKTLMPQYQKLESEMQELQEKITHLVALPEGV